MSASGYVNAELVTSVNEETGDVILDAGDIDAAEEVHTHAGTDVTSGTVAVGRLPTGTSGTTVALGDHAHAATYQPLDSDLTAFAALSPTNDDIPQRKAGVWTNRTMAQVKTDLALAKGDVGLGNVANTSDADKPVSTAQQTALDLKANLAGPTFTGTVSGISKTMVGLGNVDNTADTDKPVSTATTTALNGKSNTGHAHAAADVTSGTLVVARGGTGVASVTSGSYLRGAGTDPLVERTPSQAKTDLGLDAGGWIAPDSYGTNMAADVSGTYYDVAGRTEPNDLVRLRGRINSTVNYTAGATICTLPTAQRPARTTICGFRTGGSGAAAGHLSIDSSGVVTFTSNVTISTTGWWHLDAVSYTRTA
jgi:hypothetical protein